MFDAKTINELVESLLRALPPGLSNLPKDLEKNFRVVLQNAFQKMDLVTREEFDAQAAVLMRTRAKLEHLEKMLQELKNPPSSS